MFRIRALAQCGTIKNIPLIPIKTLGILIHHLLQLLCHCSQWIPVRYLNNLSLITEILMKRMIIFSDKHQECNKTFLMIIKIVITKLGLMVLYHHWSSIISRMFMELGLLTMPHPLFWLIHQLLTLELIRFMLIIQKLLGLMW